MLIHLQEAADSAVVRKLIGSWEWVQSFGGIAGRLITPATEGYTKTIHFLGDWSYREERNDTTFWETTYQVYQESAVDTAINVLRIGQGEPMDIFNVTDSTLELFDRCIDCYQHRYRRLPTH